MFPPMPVTSDAAAKKSRRSGRGKSLRREFEEGLRESFFKDVTRVPQLCIGDCRLGNLRPVLSIENGAHGGERHWKKPRRLGRGKS
jgi:hypothetical protein